MQPDQATVTLDEAGPDRATVVSVDNLTKRFNVPGGEEKFVVLDAISLKVHEGSFAAIVGPSGCGKSTLLNIISGIETHDPSDGGSVTVHPRAGEGGEPRIGYVFQSARLLNWLTVEGNLHFALEAQQIPRNLWGERVYQVPGNGRPGRAGEELSAQPLGRDAAARRDRPRARHRARHPADGRAVQPSRRDHRAQDGAST